MEAEANAIREQMATGCSRRAAQRSTSRQASFSILQSSHFVHREETGRKSLERVTLLPNCSSLRNQRPHTITRANGGAGTVQPDFQLSFTRLESTIHLAGTIVITMLIVLSVWLTLANIVL